jgi:hypothetical protein
MKHVAFYVCLLTLVACESNPFGVPEQDAGFNPPLTDANVNRFDSSGPLPDGSLPPRDGGNPGLFDCGDFSAINLPFDSPVFPAGLTYALANGAAVDNGTLAFNFPAGGFPDGDNRSFPILDIQGLSLTNGGRVKARLSPVPASSNTQLIIKYFFSQTNFAEVNVSDDSAIFRVSIDGTATTVANLSVADEWFSLYLDRSRAAVETSADGINWIEVANLPAAGLGSAVRVFLQGNNFAPAANDVAVFIDDVNINCSDR